MPFNEFKFQELKQRVEKLEAYASTLAQTADVTSSKDFLAFKKENDNTLDGVKQNVVNNTAAVNELKKNFNDELLQKINQLIADVKQINSKINA